MDYHVNVTAAGTYNVAFRVASLDGNKQLQLRDAGGNVLATVTVPATNGWQAWTTVNTTATLTAGEQTLRIYAASSDFNLNWFEFSSPTQESHLVTNAQFKVYPNPVSNTLTISGIKSNGMVTLINVSSGQVTRLKPANSTLNVSRLPAGTYIIEFNDGEKTVRKKFIKL